METLKYAVLGELLYERARQQCELWESLRYGTELIAAIERATRECAESPNDQAALVASLTDRAWARLAAERAGEGERVAAG